MLAVLERVTLSPDEVGADDIAAVRAAGVSDAAIEDALAVCACFNVIDRVAEAFGFMPISHALGADGLLRHEAAFLERGYV